MIFSRKPLVSVIVAAYNHAEFVRDAIMSVLNQEIGREFLEVIVVDDASSDGTPDIVEKIGDPRIKLVRSKENRRVHPRNLGLSLACGRFIAFQNSDDTWRPSKLGAQLRILKENPNVVACFTGVEIIDEKNRPKSDSWMGGGFTENRGRFDWLRVFFDYGNCLCLSSATVLASSIRQVGGFRGSLVQFSDLDLWVRLAALGDFFVVKNELTRMRIVNGKNLSRPAPENSRRGVIEYLGVLARYAEPPVRGQIKKAFADILPKENGSPDSDAVELAALARHAWTLSPVHWFFADRVLAKIFDDPIQKEEVVRLFGVKLVHEFLEKRTRLALGTVQNPP